MWCSDLSPADWITHSDVPWNQLVTFGPDVFPAYARLRFIPDPTAPGQSENDARVGEGHPTDDEQLRTLVGALLDHTATPNDLYFCLWEGWGLDGGAVYMRGDGTRTVEPPSFPAHVLAAPRVEVPHRSYLLFRGALTELGRWGAAERWPGSSATWAPAFVWPADRSWCVAKDVDPHWAGIGATEAAVTALVGDPRLDIVRANRHESQPCYA